MKPQPLECDCIGECKNDGKVLSYQCFPGLKCSDIYYEDQSLPKKMFEEDKKIEEGAHAGVSPMAKEEPQVKEVADIMKRYLESQQELMEMISTLFIRLNKFKEI